MARQLAIAANQSARALHVRRLGYVPNLKSLGSIAIE